MVKIGKTFSLLTLLLTSLACQHDDSVEYQEVDDSPLFMDHSSTSGRLSSGPYVIFKAEFFTAQGSGQAGKTIYFKDVGDKQLPTDFEQRSRNAGLTFYIDQRRPCRELAVSVTTNAIRRAMNTWDQVACSTLDLRENVSAGRVSSGFVSGLMGFGGNLEYKADIVHAGWMQGDFFDAIAPSGSTYILAVTFTIIKTDASGNYRDADQDGKLDVAWRETYYNDEFVWNIGGDFDVETVALHESGHGLSQEHFGKAFLNLKTNQIHFSPLAVMNASYSCVRRKITATDNAGHCSIWANQGH